MKQYILLFINFFKLFLSSLKSDAELLNYELIKNHLKQKFNHWHLVTILSAAVLTGLSLANLETKIANKKIVLSTMLELTFKPLEYALIGLLIILFISPFCLKNDKTRCVGDWIGYRLELIFKKVSLITWVYIAAFIMVAFDSYLISIFILLSAKCYLLLAMLIILSNCTFFTLFFELIFFGVLILEVIDFISDRVSHCHSIKLFSTEVL